jgi:hypothetical protein
VTAPNCSPPVMSLKTVHELVYGFRGHPTDSPSSPAMSLKTVHRPVYSFGGHPTDSSLAQT